MSFFLRSISMLCNRWLITVWSSSQHQLPTFVILLHLRLKQLWNHCSRLKTALMRLSSYLLKKTNDFMYLRTIYHVEVDVVGCCSDVTIRVEHVEFVVRICLRSIWLFNVGKGKFSYKEARMKNNTFETLPIKTMQREKRLRSYHVWNFCSTLFTNRQWSILHRHSVV